VSAPILDYDHAVAGSWQARYTVPPPVSSDAESPGTTFGMMARTESATSPWSIWAVRIVVFSTALLACTVLLHRLLGMSTPLAMNLFAAGIIGAAIAFLLGIVGLADIWKRGVHGLVSALGSMALAAAIFAVPLSFLPAYLSVPPLNDVSTDTESPPRFAALAKARTGTANGVEYPKQRFASLQNAFYPDLRPFVIDRPLEEAYELALDAVRRLKFQVVTEDPPNPRIAKPGVIEAVDRTIVVGFYDDVVIRIGGDRQKSRIDIRSASRYGESDMGRNATRIRRVMKELQARLDATVAMTPGERLSQLRARSAKAKAVPKRKVTDPKTGKKTVSEPARKKAKYQ
jgi:hypothetical protein